MNKNLTNENFNSYIYKNKKDLINEHYAILEREIERIKVNTIKDKNWLEKQPIMQDFLSQLQFVLQEKNIGFFSSLMTALSNDVIFSQTKSNDDNELSQTINFDLYVKGGMPALKINAKTFDNNFEKITSGGLRNVIATGLRVLALWRLTVNENLQTHKADFSHRRFLFLDEPDCWIANDSMPNYAKLLYQLSTHFNLQILMVTHKSVDYFKEYAKIYELTKQNNYTDIQLLSCPEKEIEHDENQEKIRSVRLQNVKVFKDVQFDLDNNLTIIVGKSFVGKSVIMEAFNAILNNDSDNELIRHFENKASIILNMDTLQDNVLNNYSLLWERVRKTNTEYPQKVRYRLYHNHNNKNVLLNDEFESYNVPDFAINALKMKKIDGINIHLGMQDDMNFLFNSNISDQERAKILSLGKESSYIHKMMENLKSKTRELKSNIKINEKRYNLLLENIVNITEIDTDDAIYLKLKSLEEKISSFSKIISEFNLLMYLHQYYELYENINLNNEFNTNKIQNNIDYMDELDEMIQTIYYLSNYQQFKNLTDLSFNFDKYQQIDFNSIDEIDDYLAYEQLQDISKINLETQLVNDIKRIDIYPLDELDSVGIKLKKMDEEIASLKEQQKEYHKNHSDILFEIELLQKEIGVCPLCGNNFNHNH